jgi:hypothetical protein
MDLIRTYSCILCFGRYSIQSGPGTGNRITARIMSHSILQFLTVGRNQQIRCKNSTVSRCRLRIHLPTFPDSQLLRGGYINIHVCFPRGGRPMSKCVRPSLTITHCEKIASTVQTLLSALSAQSSGTSQSHHSTTRPTYVTGTHRSKSSAVRVTPEHERKPERSGVVEENAEASDERRAQGPEQSGHRTVDLYWVDSIETRRAEDGPPRKEDHGPDQRKAFEGTVALCDQQASGRDEHRPGVTRAP